MGTKAHGRILFWEGASLWILSAPPGIQFPRTDFHSHHAVQVTLALTGRVQFDGEAERIGGGAIAIELRFAGRAEEPDLEVAVRDSGVGIREAEVDLLFEPFFSTKSGADKRGLGLAICRDIVSSWNGQITAENVPGGGTKIRITVPPGRYISMGLS